MSGVVACCRGEWYQLTCTAIGSEYGGVLPHKLPRGLSVVVPHRRDTSCLLAPPPGFFAFPDAVRYGSAACYRLRRSVVPMRVTWHVACRYNGVPVAEDMLAFVNGHCGSFRALDGRLSDTGDAIRALELHAWGSTSYIDVEEGGGGAAVLATPELDQQAEREGWRVGAKPMVVRQCERIDASQLSQAEFMAQFVARSRPVVLTGAVDPRRFARWTTEYFEQELGSNTVHVKVGHSCAVLCCAALCHVGTTIAASCARILCR